MNKPKKGLDWLEQALRRLAEHRSANLATFAAFEARMEETLRQAEKRRAQRWEARNTLIEALQAQHQARPFGSKRPPKPPGPRKARPDDDGGEPMPAIPRPRPRPLSGGAAAPIEKESRLKKSESRPLRVKGRPAKVPSEADRSPFL
jgi:hypothetical protein